MYKRLSVISRSLSCRVYLDGWLVSQLGCYTGVLGSMALLASCTPDIAEYSSIVLYICQVELQAWNGWDFFGRALRFVPDHLLFSRPRFHLPPALSARSFPPLSLRCVLFFVLRLQEDVDMVESAADGDADCQEDEVRWWMTWPGGLANPLQSSGACFRKIRSKTDNFYAHLERHYNMVQERW